MTQPPAARKSASAEAQSKVLGKALLRCADLLGLNGARLAVTIGVSEASVSRLVNGSRDIDLNSKEGELAALLIRCFRSLDVLVGGNDEQRRAWMTAHNHALNGVPCELIASAQGLVTTVAYLDRMRAPL